ncbi:MAG: type II toxin-antitoxin system VapC family toxin [Hyphomicrobiales bacterium]
MTAVLDSSALLALLWSEPGSEEVGGLLDQASVSAVNLAEVCSKLVDRGVTGAGIRHLLSALPVRVVAFDEKQALQSGELRAATRQLGLSLGDRACLGLAMAEKTTAVTADRAWTGLELGIAIRSIR